MMQTKEFFTIREVADGCGVSYGTVKRDIDNGRLSAYRIGRKFFIKSEEAAAYTEAQLTLRKTKGYTISELSAKFPLSYAFLMSLVQKGELHAVRVGRQYLVPYEEFESYLKEKKL